MYRILFFGTPDFSVPSLEALVQSPLFKVIGVVTQPDKAKGRGQSLLPSPIKTVALKHNIPVLQPLSIKKEKEQFLAELSSIGPVDASVVIAFGQILPLEVLSYGKAGSINVHASLLPRWRGAAPMQRALMSGDTESGLCLMKMEEGLDTGAVYVSSKVPLTDVMTFGDLHSIFSTLSAELLLKHLKEIIDGSCAATPQSNEGVTYATRISNDECRINWKESSTSILHHIHGLSPIPGAFTVSNGKRIKILKVKKADAAGSKGLTVPCGDGTSLEILSLQPEGKRPMSGSDFLRGFHGEVSFE